MSGVVGGKPFVEQLRHVAKDAKAIISWGCCASRGCVQAAKPNPTQATPQYGSDACPAAADCIKTITAAQASLRQATARSVPRSRRVEVAAAKA